MDIIEGRDIERVVFTGDTREWFGIWIVNLLLSIVTLGIYSAWAKVRREQYFKRNTSIGGRSFDYHATGGQILIGRLIVLGGIAALYLSAAYMASLYFVLILALFGLTPWLIIRSLRFRARVTSWSNVRFDFHGDYADAFLVFIMAPIGVAMTLYTTFPLLARARTRFSIDGHFLGTHDFRFESDAGPFYKAFGIALAVGIGGMIALFTLSGTLLGSLAVGDTTFETTPLQEGIFVLGVYAVFILAFLPAYMLFGALLRNHIYASTELKGGHRFVSNVNPWKLTWIMYSNAIVSVLSLGLLLPWTQIRVTRYLADHTLVEPNGSLDDIAGDIEMQGSAIGDAYADFEGLELGLPI